MLFVQSRNRSRLARTADSRRPVESLENRVLFSAGDLDTTFSGDGKLAVPDTVAGRGVSELFVYPDGKVLTAGFDRSGSRQDLLVTRYNANGSLDTTFGKGGRATVDFGGDDYATGLAVGTDGKIVVSATMPKGTYEKSWVLARFTASGALDTTFDGDGKLTLGIGGTVTDVAVAPGNKIVAVGTSGASRFTVMRFTASGAADTSFSGDGSRR